jgi:hypothetical protein
MSAGVRTNLFFCPTDPFARPLLSQRFGDDLDREDSRLNLPQICCGFAQRPLKARLPRREVGLRDDELSLAASSCAGLKAQMRTAPPGALSLVDETATGSSLEVRHTFNIP